MSMTDVKIVKLDTNEDILVRVGGTIFTGATGGSISNLTLTAPGGTVFNLSGANTQNLIFRDSIVANSGSVGTISGFGLVFLSVVQYSGNTNGITYNNITDLLMSNLAEARPVEILLVEDNPGDVLLTQEAFKRAKIRNNLVVAPDGEVALKILAKEEGYEDAKTPDLILLDLNLPKFNGKEVLEKVKSSDKLKRIPIVVLSSSKAEQDINQSYDLHANSYVPKPIDIQKLAAIVQSIESFWFSVVQLPK